MKVTLSDIAEALGVSTATVSRALNNRGRIGSATRQAVIAKALEMGYPLPEKNNSQSRMVGIIFDKRLRSLAADPFYSTVMIGVEQECKRHDSQVFFQTIDQKTDHTLRLLFSQNRLHGLIIVGGDIQNEFVGKLQGQEIPLVLVDNCLDGVDCVVSDNAGGVQKTLRHLFELGHERIGFVGGPLAHPSLRERYDTYRLMLENRGIPYEAAWSWIHNEPGPSVEQGYQAILAWADSGPALSALVADNDSTAVGMLRGCVEKGIRVPEDLSIVGYDNISLAEHIAPGITSVHVDKLKMGEWAAKRVHELMDKIDAPVKIVISTKLVVRGSSGMNSRSKGAPLSLQQY